MLVIAVVILHLPQPEIITFAPNPGFLSNKKMVAFVLALVCSSNIVAADMSHAAHQPMIAMIIVVYFMIFCLKVKLKRYNFNDFLL